MKPIAIVQHEPSVPPGTIREVLVDDRLDHVIVEAWKDVEWPEAADLAGVIVLGGTMNVDETERYPFLRTSAELMSNALASDVAILGVCLGAQMLARVLGQPVRRSDIRSAGFSTLRMEPEAQDDPLVSAFASDIPVLQFHEDTFSTPTSAVTLATSSSSGLVQAFRYGHSAYGIQFHFEVDRAILRGWCRNIGPAALRADWGATEDELIAQADESIDAQGRAGRQLVRAFAALTEAAARAG